MCNELTFEEVTQIRELDLFRRERIIEIDETVEKLKLERAKVIEGCGLKSLAEKFEVPYHHVRGIVNHRVRVSE